MTIRGDGITFEVLPHGASGEALIPLFETVFGVRLSLAQWLWKYEHESSFHVVCRTAEGSPVGHAAVQYAGRLPSGLLVGQVGDVMVHPAHRGQLTAGVFAQLLDMLAQEAVARGFGLCYGFPGERPARLGLRLGIYEEVGRPQAVHIKRLPRRWMAAWISRLMPLVREVGNPPAVLEQMANGARLGRNADFIRWRYVDSPLPYRFFSVRLGEGLPAFAVCHKGADGVLRVIDWFGGRPTIKCLRRLADFIGEDLVVWAQLLPGELGLEFEQTPFLTIRLPRVGEAETANAWFTNCEPGDVDVF